MLQRKLKVYSENWLEEPFAISRGYNDNFDVVVVEIEERGFKGWGECTPTKHYDETIFQTKSQINKIRSRIENGISRIELQSIMPKGAARNALDSALWDLEAKKAGKRIWELSKVLEHLQNGHLSKPKIVTSVYTLGLDTPKKMGEIAKKHAKRPILKIKLTGDGDLERLFSVRENAPDSRLIIDANEGWEQKHYTCFIPEFLKLGVEMIEQPFPAHKDNLLKKLEHPIPICADESCHDRSDLSRLEGLYEFINIKLDKTGGLTEAINLQREAKSKGFKTMIGCMSSTSLGIAPAFLIAQNANIVDLDAPLYLFNDRPYPIKFELSQIFPPSKNLWG